MFVFFCCCLLEMRVLLELGGAGDALREAMVEERVEDVCATPLLLAQHHVLQVP